MNKPKTLSNQNKNEINTSLIKRSLNFYLLNSLSNINSSFHEFHEFRSKLQELSSKEIDKGAFTNYGVNILPIIDHLPRPLLTFVTKFFYCFMYGKIPVPPTSTFQRSL